MKRAFIVLAAAIMVTGCAVDASDPITQYPDREPTPEPPPTTTTFSGELKEQPQIPRAQIDPADVNGSDVRDLGNWQVVELPATGK